MSMLADDLGAFLKTVWPRLPLKLQADLVSSYTESMDDSDDTDCALDMAIDNMNDSDEYAAEFAMEVLKAFAGYAFPKPEMEDDTEIKHLLSDLFEKFMEEKPGIVLSFICGSLEGEMMSIDAHTPHKKALRGLVESIEHFFQLQKKGMQFPLIVVERPHQSKGKAWVAFGPECITNQLHERNYGDNWSRDEYQCLDDWISDFGACEDEWPEGVEKQIQEIGFPMVACQDGSGEMQLYRPADAPSELDFAIEYMGHDLHAVDLLESREDAEEMTKCRLHNVPYQGIQDCLEQLGW